MRSTGAYSAPSARDLPLRKSEENAVALLIGNFQPASAQILEAKALEIRREITNFAVD